MTHQILIRQSKDENGRDRYNTYGALWDCVWLLGLKEQPWGQMTLCEAVRDPEHAAARAGYEEGLRGPFETIDERGMVRMRFKSIERAAKQTVRESYGRPEVARWKPFPRATGSPPLSEENAAGPED